MKTVDVIIPLAGLLWTLSAGFTAASRERAADNGEAEATQENEYGVHWQPYIGMGIMAIGAAVLMFDRKKSLAR